MFARVKTITSFSLKNMQGLKLTFSLDVIISMSCSVRSDGLSNYKKGTLAI